ncbi:hypothetical protein RB595_004039 [Gaeumannomyces hyphopodioides]
MHIHNQITMNYNTKGRPLGGLGGGSVRRPGKPQQGRPGPGGPVDPDELSRRLHLVLADQKAYAERKKRAAKAEAAAAKSSRSPPPPAAGKEQSSSGSSSRGLVIRKSMSILDKAKRKTSRVALREPRPHPDEAGRGPYVPREAAAQFALTTTATNMSGGGGGLTHKLSRNALKFHLEADHVDPNAPPAEQTKALRRAQSRREQLHERNQFQRTRILEEAAEADEDREQAAHQIRSHRHTFTGALGGGPDHHHQNNQQNQKNRRSSTGDFLEYREKDSGDSRHALPMPPASPGRREDSPPPKYYPSQDAVEHRVDWTQSDETKPIQRARTVPLLKRPSSIWTLRGRFGNKGSKHSRGEKEVAIDGAIDEAPELSKPSKVGFFSRFRR